MNKIIKKMSFFAFTLLLLIPLSVFAIEITSDDLDAAIEGDTSKGITYDDVDEKFVFAEGEYTIGEDLELGNTFFEVDDANVTFDLNGKELSTENSGYGVIEVYGESVVTITGNGTISGPYYSLYSEENTVLNIENGTFNGRIEAYGWNHDNQIEYAYLNIKNGTFNSIVYLEYANAVIDNGTFDTTESDSDAVYVTTGSSIEINGGTFTSPYSGVMAEPYAEWDEETDTYEYEGTIKSVVINGGTFTGKKVGFVFTEVDKISVKAGTFKADGEDAVAGIAVIGENAELLSDILAEGSEFEPSLDAAAKEVEGVNIIASQKEISVVDTSKNDYKYTEGENLEYDPSKDESATFRINTEYKYFENGGKVFVDEELVDEANYSSKSGSTVIEFTKEYMASLKAGEHSLKVVFNNNKEATTKFTIKDNTEATANPQTGDYIINYVLIGLMSMIGLSSIIYLKKREN